MIMHVVYATAAALWNKLHSRKMKDTILAHLISYIWPFYSHTSQIAYIGCIIEHGQGGAG